MFYLDIYVPRKKGEDYVRFFFVSTLSSNLPRTRLGVIFVLLGMAKRSTSVHTTFNSLLINRVKYYCKTDSSPINLSSSHIVKGVFLSYVVHCRIDKFQHSVFHEIRTLVPWLKSTLLLKIECFDTHIYMKTYCLQ